MCIYVYVYMFICVCVYMCLCVCVSVSLCLCVSVYVLCGWWVGCLVGVLAGCWLMLGGLLVQAQETHPGRQARTAHH